MRPCDESRPVQGVCWGGRYYLVNGIPTQCDSAVLGVRYWAERLGVRPEDIHYCDVYARGLKKEKAT